MRIRKTLSSWLVTKYLLIIRNEENFAEKTTLSFTYSKVILFAVLIFIVLMLVSLFLVQTLLAQWFDPRHEQAENNKKLEILTEKVDSLEMEVIKKDKFIQNFQRIVSGDTVLIDSTFKTPETESLPISNRNSPDKIDPIDSQFRQEFEQMDIALASYDGTGVHDLEEIFFFTPIIGFISDKYNVKEQHYGVDIVAKKNEPVKCVADGTVILASWTQDSGHILAVQHRGNIISVYKHNAEILKKVGSFVSGGEIISIVGNTGELTNGPHLHFELWYKGNPVNPEEFVSF